MAMSWCVVRRAASIATRSARAPPAPASSYSRLCFLPFSTTHKSPNSKPTTSGKDRWSFHNIGDKIHQEIIASCSNEVAPVPNGLPFDLLGFPGHDIIFMERIYQKERIKIHFPTNIEDGSSLPLTFVLQKGDFTFTSLIDAKPDQLHIRKVFMNLSNKGGGMTDFGLYFKSLGITSKTIRFLYDRLGNLRKNASGASHKLDGIPFDFMEEDPEGGSIFLKRKTDDAIVNILALPVLTTDELQESLGFFYNDSFIYDDFEIDYGGDDGDEMINEEEDESIEEEGDGEDSELSADEDDSELSAEDSELSVEEDDSELSAEEEDRVPGLSLLVKIQHGNNLDRCLEFVGHASPNHDLIFINGISFRKARKSGRAVGLNHLDEFEDFFRKRGVEPGNFNFLFNYIPKLNQMNNVCASIGN